jgi:hypothetical protein
LFFQIHLLSFTVIQVEFFLLFGFGLTPKRLRISVDVRDEPALFGLVDNTNAFSAQILDIIGQSQPSCGIHVNVILVADVLLVDDVGVNALGAKTSAQRGDVASAELAREAIHILGRVVGEEEQLPLMRLGHCVTFEAVLNQQTNKLNVQIDY